MSRESSEVYFDKSLILLFMNFMNIDSIFQLSVPDADFFRISNNIRISCTHSVETQKKNRIRSEQKKKKKKLPTISTPYRVRAIVLYFLV